MIFATRLNFFTYSVNIINCTFNIDQFIFATFILTAEMYEEYVKASLFIQKSFKNEEQRINHINLHRGKTGIMYLDKNIMLHSELHHLMVN